MGELLARSSPTPLQELSNRNVKNEFVSLFTDGRRKPKACFCYRELAGTAKTLLVKKIVCIYLKLEKINFLRNQGLGGA